MVVSLTADTKTPFRLQCFKVPVQSPIAPAPRAKLLMLEDAAHMTIFSHPTRIAEAVDELWGGALRYEEEL